MIGSGRESFPDVQKWPVVVGKPSRMSGSGRRLSLISGSGREALPGVREWSRGPPGCPEVVGKPSGCPVVVERPSQMSKSGQE